jgi:hypothetical protein
MCIDNTGYEHDLTLFQIYRVLPAPKDEPHGMLRVIDNTREDYLFGAGRFVPVKLPAESERAFTELLDRLNQEWAAYLATLGPEDEDCEADDDIAEVEKREQGV